MDILDVVSKVFVPIVVPVLSAVGAWLFARSGIRQRQLQIVDLATKRIAFWDAYFKIGLSATESESGERRALEHEVRCAIQRIRTETGQELRRISWSELIAQKRVAAVKLRGVPKFKWVCCWMLTYIFLAILIAFFAYVLWISTLAKKDLGFRTSLAVEVITVVLLALALTLRLGADRIKYPKPRPIAEEI